MRNCPCATRTGVGRAPWLHRRQVHAFTLIELLVVVSLIVLLIAMLLPALGRARSIARNVSCLSNQRQMVNGVHGYAADYEHKLFPIVHSAGYYWFSMFGPYWGENQEVIICPEASEPSYGLGNARLAWGPGGGFMDGHMGSYGMNLWFLPTGVYDNDGNMHEDGYFRHTRQGDASKIPVFGDSQWVGAWPDDGDSWPSDTFSPPNTHAKGFFMNRFCNDRHDFAINVAFLDGNARNVKLPDLWQYKWHRTFEPTTPAGAP